MTTRETPQVPFLDHDDERDCDRSIGYGSVALLLNPEGIVLHLRDDDPAISNPGRWSLLGGARERDEGPEATVQRELVEEISVDVRVLRPLWQLVDWEGDRRLLHVFVVSTRAHIEEMTLSEGQAVAAFTLDAALRLDLAPLARRVLSEWSPDRWALPGESR